MLIGLFTPNALGRPRPNVESSTPPPLYPSQNTDSPSSDRTTSPQSVVQVLAVEHEVPPLFPSLMHLVYGRPTVPPSLIDLSIVHSAPPFSEVESSTVLNPNPFTPGPSLGTQMYLEQLQNRYVQSDPTPGLLPGPLNDLYHHFSDVVSNSYLELQTLIHVLSDECVAVEETYLYNITIINNQDLEGYSLRCDASDLTVLNGTGLDVYITKHEFDPFLIVQYRPVVLKVIIDGNDVIVYTNTSIPDLILWHTSVARSLWSYLHNSFPSLPSQLVEYYWWPVIAITWYYAIKLVGLIGFIVGVVAFISFMLIFHVRFGRMSLYEYIRYRFSLWRDPLPVVTAPSLFDATFESTQIITDTNDYDRRLHAFKANSAAATRAHEAALALYDSEVKRINKLNEEGVKQSTAALKEHGTKVTQLRAQLADRQKSKRDIHAGKKKQKSGSSASHAHLPGSIATIDAAAVLNAMQKEQEEISADIARLNAELEDDGPIRYELIPLPAKPVLEVFIPPEPPVEYQLVAYGDDILGATVAYLRSKYNGPLPTDYATRHSANSLANNFVADKFSTRLSVAHRNSIVTKAVFLASFPTDVDYSNDHRLGTYAARLQRTMLERSRERRITNQ